MNDQADRYVVPQSNDEADRLHDQSRIIERPSRYVIQQSGLGSGMTALDVGCGAGDLMRLMGEAVGEQGSVTGIDLNGDLGQRVAAELNREGSTRYSFIGGNFLEMAMPDGGPFDLVISRLVFKHLPDPERAARTLWSWTKPGGVLAIMEYDLRLVDSEPPTVAASILQQTIYAVDEKANLDNRCGAKLPSLLRRATGSEPDGVDVATRLLPLTEIATFLRSTYLGYAAVAEKLGLSHLPPRSAFLADLDRALGEDVRFFAPILVSTWKRKAG